MPKKLTYGFVKEEFGKEGYKLLSDEYINSHQKLYYICPVGHKHSVTWSNWNSRKIRCPYCAGVVFKHTTEKIRIMMKKENYVLITKKYHNNKQQLYCICPVGHLYRTRWDNWVNGHRCPTCAGQGKPTIEDIKQIFNKENYILLSKEYINNTAKLEYICSEGHKGNIAWTSWLSGSRCKYCAKNVRHTIEFVRSEFEKEGYKLLSEYYVNQKQKLKYICPFGHTHEITWTDWHNGGYRCPSCYAIKISGEGNYNWKGGISKEPYSKTWNNRLKKDIKERDGYRCLNPYCYSNNTKDLVVHHINYDKKDCTKQNLITICRACNIRAEVNRNWHKAWYQAIMHRRYNYIY